jgi:hypothetical protein
MTGSPLCKRSCQIDPHWTILSAIVFRELKDDDGETVSLRKILPHVG